MDAFRASLFENLQNIRDSSPLILNLTNLVAMDFNANALLALGASPIMSQAQQEITELVSLSRSVVINIGTLNTEFLETAQFVLIEAKKYGKPVVLDPVGAGATHLRTETARSFFCRDMSAVRGNASEIASLFENARSTKGVDSTISSDSVMGLVRAQTKKIKTVVTVSGETDYVIFEGKVAALSHGDPMMAKVTAMGCTATALIGAFLAVSPSAFHASVQAMAVMGIAGEKAKKSCSGPGSFRTAFLDALHNLSEKDFSELRVQFI